MLMRVLIDTNVLLDVLLQRQPWATDSDAVWQANDQGYLAGFISATVATNLFYIARRARGNSEALQAVRACLDSFEICPVDRAILEAAIALPGADFEDNVLIACAQAATLDGIVTRDKGDFTRSGLAVFTPAELIVQLRP